MRRTYSAMLFCSFLLLSACQTGVGITIGNVSLWGSKTVEATKPTKPLTLFDGQTFNWFGKVFWNELQEKRIITDKGKATVIPPEPASSFSSGDEYVPESYGNALYTRLSLSFLWPAPPKTSKTNQTADDTNITPDSANLLQTHNACPSTGEDVNISQFGLKIEGEFESHEYTMVALLDWNGSNVRDWLVKHLNTNALTNTTTTRMLVIPAPEPQGIFRAETIWAQECKGGNCTTYVRDTLPEFTGYTSQIGASPSLYGATQIASDHQGLSPNIPPVIPSSTPVRAPEALN